MRVAGSRASGWCQAGGIAAAAVAVACASQTKHDPCFGVTTGDQIAITIIDVAPNGFGGGSLSYDSGSPNVCGFGFDLVQGQVLQATVTQNIPNDTAETVECAVANPRVAPFGGWTWTMKPDQSGGNSPDVLFGLYTATGESCNGGVLLEVRVMGSDAFAPYVPGQPPNVVMRRWFSGPTDASPCPASCQGYFIVNLQKLG